MCGIQYIHKLHVHYPTVVVHHFVKHSVDLQPNTELEEQYYTEAVHYITCSYRVYHRRVFGHVKVKFTLTINQDYLAISK